MSEKACPPDANGRSTAPASVLLVEDNLIIALDTEEMLKEMGVALVMAVESADAAMAILEQQRPEFVLLDVDLVKSTSFGVAERADALGIRFAFTTGYGDRRAFPKAFANSPAVQKPYGIDALRHVVCRPT